MKGFFGFSRAETNAFLILLPLMFLLIFFQPAYQYWFVRQPRDYTKEKNQLDSLVATMEWPSDSISSSKEVEKNKEIKPVELFEFNPNLCSKDELKRLGFDQTLANRVINYRGKGGRFQIKKDLRKIYGMDSTFYQKLSPYITLPDSILKTQSILKSKPKEKTSIAKFDLNTADTSQFIKIYGIGPKLARRIIAYRSKLGGFISGDQLTEVYGLDSLAVKNLRAKSFIEEEFQPTQVNINVVAERELASHPYVKYKLAKAIIAYRMQHGSFNSVDDLKKITLISEADLLRMKPYLVTQ